MTVQRPFVVLTGKDSYTLAQECVPLLQPTDDPTIFRTAGGLAELRKDLGHVSAVPLSLPRLRAILEKRIAFLRNTASGQKVADVPPALVNYLREDPADQFPVLKGILRAPVVDQRGVLRVNPGYDPKTGFFLDMDPREIGPIPDEPASGEVAQAIYSLCTEALGDFPFVSEADRANALATMITPMVRPMIMGPTPLHVIEAHTPGTGKTTLASILAMPALGHLPEAVTEGENPDEWRKRISADLFALPPFVFLDNLSKKLASPALASVLTAGIWKDRKLATSEMKSVPVNSVFLATGNNVEYSKELRRRVVSIRIHRNDPQKRFKHPSILLWAEENRADLVWACLILIKNWLAKDRPLGQVTIPSYIEYSQILGGILEAAGIPGFLGNLEETQGALDEESLALMAFFKSVYERTKGTWVNAADFLDLAESSPYFAEAFDGKERRGCLAILGKRLVKIKGHEYGGITLHQRVGGDSNSNQYAFKMKG